MNYVDFVLIVKHFNPKNNRYSFFKCITLEYCELAFVFSVLFDYNPLLIKDLQFLQLRNSTMA